MTKRRELEGHVFRRHLSTPSIRPSGVVMRPEAQLAAIKIPNR